RFRVSGNYILRPAFSANGVLIAISVAPRASSHVSDPQLSAVEFEGILAKLDSVKRIGSFVEDGFSWESGKKYRNRRYENAYISTAAVRLEAPPPPIFSATISYIH